MWVLSYSVTEKRTRDDGPVVDAGFDYIEKPSPTSVNDEYLPTDLTQSAHTATVTKNPVSLMP